MSTIALNADEVLNEDTQDKKKFEFSDKAKAAMAAGVAGAAVGAGVKTAIDAFRNKSEDDPISEPGDEDNQDTPTSHTAAHTQPSESVSATVVNPDVVMLEEPVLESNDEELVAEEIRPNEGGSEYQPFANSDVIEDVVYEGPLPEDPLYAQDINMDNKIEEVIVDLICGEPNHIDGEIEVTDYQPDDQYTWEPEPYDESDIQSDLMA